MTLVDSHCHLAYDEISCDLPGKLRAAQLAGVEYFLTVSTDSKSVGDNLKIAETHENVCCSVGIHPLSADEPYEIAELEQYLHREEVVAVGEIGLDYHHDDVPSKPAQMLLFEGMLSMAINAGLPCIFHARECFGDIFDVIRQSGVTSGVFHCYTSSLEDAKRVLDLGFYISFSGVVTFKKSEDLREVAKYVPSDRVLVETDCPYLAPVPHRGKPNEPAFTALVAECLAQVRNTTLDEIARITTGNFFDLFSKAKIALNKLD
jgi:TatD DNase family protein